MINNISGNQLGHTENLRQQKSISGAQLSMNSVSFSDGNTTFSGDQVSFSYFKIEESTTYTNTGSIQAASDAAYNLLRGYVLDVFEKQGMDFTIAIGDETIDFEKLSTEDAQGLISEDGYFGVEQTSDRIVEFATGLAGNDPSRIDAILEGVKNGFNEALEAFGGWLPDISYNTYDSVLEKLDNWTKEVQS